MPYLNFRNDLEDNIIYKGEQALIPQALREVIKQRLHVAHLGYNSMMQRVHTAVCENVTQKKSALFHYESNDKAEAAVRTIKTMFEGSERSNQGPLKAQIGIRNNSGKDTNKSPAENDARE
ncbi:hypothetical protein ElyMa_000229400 [Elysia marginata]|uniref:Integrase zinc-binding domain-containing protein n=1 Tax=Elysia marginata TaxID=1093978 RepID=A0AAV4F214_9GAST|nr:hypothetical protein ElyMa_000229400 [Elysia marginata]